MSDQSRTSEPPPGVESDLPWTSDELRLLNRETLSAILAHDMKAAAIVGTPASLRKQILTVQQTQEHRGIVRWVEHGPDEILLYEPGHARFGRNVVGLLESLHSWRDLQQLAWRRSPESRWILQIMWDRWDPQCPEECGIWDESALEEYYEEEPRVSGIKDLLEAFPSAMPLELPNQNGDGDYIFIDPFNARQMGVPILLFERYYMEHSTMMSTWSSVPRGYLPFVRESASAIGWHFASGDRSDLPFG